MTGDRCDAMNINPRLGDWRCARQPAAPYRRGCLHEHFTEPLLCSYHANRPGVGLCPDCLHHPTDPHECGIRLQPLAGIS
jgi:hypothetical protein